MIAFYEEALGRRPGSRRSTPGASGLCQCGVRAVPGASVLSHRGDHGQIHGAHERHGVVGDADLGHCKVRAPFGRLGGHERTGCCLPREQPDCRDSVPRQRRQVSRDRHRAEALDPLLRRGLRQRGQSSGRVLGAGELEVHHAERARRASPDCFCYEFRARSGSDVGDLCAHSDSEDDDSGDHAGHDGSDVDGSDFRYLGARPCSDVDDSGPGFVDDFCARARPGSDGFRACPGCFAGDFYARRWCPLRPGAVVLRHRGAELFRE
jgi:hypothetical protein